MRIRDIIKNIFSITNSKTHKIITVFFIKFKIKRNKKSKIPYLVLLDPGGIGDYTFCRPYFKYIKKSPKYKSYKIIYITKDIYADMTKCYNSSSFDEILGYNTKNYKYLFKHLKGYNIKTLINLRCIVLEEGND